MMSSGHWKGRCCHSGSSTMISLAHLSSPTFAGALFTLTSLLQPTPLVSGQKCCGSKLGGSMSAYTKGNYTQCKAHEIMGGRNLAEFGGFICSINVVGKTEAEIYV